MLRGSPARANIRSPRAPSARPRRSLREWEPGPVSNGSRAALAPAAASGRTIRKPSVPGSAPTATIRREKSPGIDCARTGTSLSHARPGSPSGATQRRRHRVTAHCARPEGAPASPLAARGGRMENSSKRRDCSSLGNSKLPIVAQMWVIRRAPGTSSARSAVLHRAL